MKEDYGDAGDAFFHISESFVNALNYYEVLDYLPFIWQNLMVLYK